MGPVIHHRPDELRRGLHCVISGSLTAQFREVEEELRLAGFVTGLTTLTRAGWRYLYSGPEQQAAA